MPISLQLTCDISQGLNFSPTHKGSFGYLSTLSIGGEAIPADWLGVDPLVSRAKSLLPKIEGSPQGRGTLFSKPVVGVIDSLAWDGGHSDPLRLSFLVSVDNWGRLDVLFRTKIDSDTKVDYCLVVYKWDYLSSGYFLRFCSDGPSGRGGKSEPQTCFGYVYSADDSEMRAADKSLDVEIADQPEQERAGHLLGYRVSLKLQPPSQEAVQLFRICASPTAIGQFRWHEQAR
jgi:hypothetical protein